MIRRKACVLLRRGISGSWAILYDLTHGLSLAQAAPLSLVRLLQKGGERTYNSGVSQAFKGAIFFFYKVATFRDHFH